MPHASPLPDKALESGPVCSVHRAELRREKIAAREALSIAEHQHLSASIESHLSGLLEYCPPQRLAFCWPIRGEFDCRPLVSRLIAAGVQACLPRVTAPGAALTFCAWKPETRMLTDRYGIHYPADCALLTPDLLLLPVNAFDDQGYRLGYGGGYFDRTLAAFAALPSPPVAIGLGFELARVPSIFPEAHDLPLDAVVTESGAQLFSSRLRDAFI